MKVLVVDDSRETRFMLRTILEGLGYQQIIEAVDGAEGWRVFEENRDVALVITDWDMPEKNGLELIRDIRGVDDRVPVLLVTAFGARLDIVQALKAGANAYLTKPLNAKVLEQKLAFVFGPHGGRKGGHPR